MRPRLFAAGLLLLAVLSCTPPAAPGSPSSRAPSPTPSSVAAVGARPAAPGQCGPGVTASSVPCPDDPVWDYGEATRASGCTFRVGSDGKALLPDPACSPGGRNRNLSRDVVCGVGWPAGQHFTTTLYRDVPEAVKARVFDAYGIPSSGSATLPLASGGTTVVQARGGSAWEIDHIRSLEDMGTNGAQPGTSVAQWNLGNLYPQPAAPAGSGFHEKDGVETLVHNDMCARSGGGYKLTDAQAEAEARQLVTDWTVLSRSAGATLKSLPPKAHDPATGDETGD